MKKRRCAICGGTDIRVNYTAWGAKYYFCFSCDRDVREIRDSTGEVKFIRNVESEAGVMNPANRR